MAFTALAAQEGAGNGLDSVFHKRKNALHAPNHQCRRPPSSKSLRKLDRHNLARKATQLTNPWEPQKSVSSPFDGFPPPPTLPAALGGVESRGNAVCGAGCDFMGVAPSAFG